MKFDVRREDTVPSYRMNQNHHVIFPQWENIEKHRTVVSPIGTDDLPPPYSSATGGVPMVTCRVCQAMIDIGGKVEQHVVK
ncbi:hypothetical protein Anas_14554 [Armadillidium nasatum]|uniref:Phosphatidylinositol-4,5-bisphosphate 4-phosphatase n=1 Tax=Armadillidium nasatum TaxID=96803 RepID=A0A5N5T8S2_9CRUS|nr:hypothetical protein Anas_14554 [Armadillidium nasatum]